MMSKAFWLGATLALCPLVSEAQAPAANPVYRRAQTMVNDGNAATGRALVDSMIAVAAPGSNDYAEGVYWRAVLAATAADAEMDYRRLVVDYSMSPRVEDALIRLAQLEIARGNYDGALRHLNRLAAEHPQSASRPRATYWTARALFDKNDVQGGCAATANALAIAGVDDSELRNQITYLNQRCAGIVLASPPGTSAAAAPISGISVPTTTVPTTTVPTTTVPTTTVPTTTVPATSTPATSIPIAAAPIISTPAPTIAAGVTDSSRTSPKVLTKVLTVPRDSAAATSKPALTPASRPRVTPTVPLAEVPASVGEKSWSVQVAAYSVKSQADAMVAKLRKSGYEARVDGRVIPFRVRIGKYATPAQAAAVQRSLKAKQITGFVVQAETQ